MATKVSRQAEQKEDLERYKATGTWQIDHRFALQCFDSSFQFINTESPLLHRTPPQKSESSYYNGQDQQHQISHETPKSLKGFSRASRARDTSLRSVVPDLLR